MLWILKVPFLKGIFPDAAEMPECMWPVRTIPEPLLNVPLEQTDYCKGPFLVPKATPELNLNFLLWKSELKVPVVEKKLIPAWVPGPTLIQFYFQLYFYPHKFLWKICGSLIVSWSICQRACDVFCRWACCVAALAALSDESRATGFKYKNTPDQNSFLRVTLKYCTVCIHVQLCNGWSNWRRSLRSLRPALAVMRIF